MPARAAGENTYVLETLPLSFAESDVFEVDRIRIERKSSENRIPDRRRLLVNFLEHEVLISALLSHDRIPCDLVELWLAFLAGGIEEANSIGRHDSNLMFIEEENRSRVREHGRNIRRNESFAINAAHDDWSALANGDDLLRIIRGHDRESEEAFKLCEHFQYGLLEVSLEILFNHVGDHFGIRFRRELVAFFDELALEGEVILDDAVVRDNDPAFAVPMRMRVFLGGPPVGRPTCVTETELSGHRLLDEKILEVFQLAGRSANLKLLIVDNGYTGGVIATVFE